MRLDGTDKQAPPPRFPAVDDLVPSPDEQLGRLHVARQRLRHGAARRSLTKEPPEVALKEGAVPVWRLSDDAGGYVALGRRRQDASRGRSGNTFYRLPLAGAVDFAEEQRRKAEEKAKKDGAPKKDAAGTDEGQGRQGEGRRSRRRELPKAETIAIALSDAARRCPQGSFVLHGARVVTMKGDEVLENADILVTGNRIAAVGAAGTLAAPAGREGFDAAGKTIIPGLIDTHAHLHYSGFELVPGDQVGVRREPRLRRDDDLRPVGALARRLRAGRDGRGGADGRAAHLLVRRRALRRPAGRTSSPRSTTSTTRCARCGA